MEGYKLADTRHLINTSADQTFHMRRLMRTFHDLGQDELRIADGERGLIERLRWQSSIAAKYLLEFCKQLRGLDVPVRLLAPTIV
jgi:hypothetical protein